MCQSFIIFLFLFYDEPEYLINYLLNTPCTDHRVYYSQWNESIISISSEYTFPIISSYIPHQHFFLIISINRLYFSYILVTWIKIQQSRTCLIILGSNDRQINPTVNKQFVLDEVVNYVQYLPNNLHFNFNVKLILLLFSHKLQNNT